MKAAFVLFAVLLSSSVLAASWLDGENPWYSESSGPVTYTHVQTPSYKVDSWPHYERTVDYGASPASGYAAAGYSGGFEAFGFSYSSGYASSYSAYNAYSSYDAYSYGPAYGFGSSYGSYYAYNEFPSTYYYPPMPDGYGEYYGYSGQGGYGCYACGCVGWRC